jgi:tyrosine-protein phosphatase SIW14
VYSRFRMFKRVVVLILFLASAASLAGSDLPSSNNIPRFQMLADGLYRGGQPDKKGFEFLKQKGVKTVINLRMENDEEGTVKQLGMNYVQIAIDDPRPSSKIPELAISKYFEIVNDPASYPIFFHCRRGADRTGALAALYRIANQGWEAKKAYSEARDVGLRWWYTGIKKQLMEFKTSKPRTTTADVVWESPNL